MKGKNTEEMKDKKVLVVGMGRSGIAAAHALQAAGAVVSVQDSKKEEEIDKDFLDFVGEAGIKKYFGTVPEGEQFDMAVLSPGVPPALEFIQKAKDGGAEIIGELELAYRMGGGKYVAITGTNGKTTTTTLVGEMFKNAGRKTCVVGNIGVAVITDAMNADDDTWMVTETSSFQLETTEKFRPVVSAILNLTEDHMDRHKTMENYGAAKARIFRNQTKDEYLVINKDDAACYALAEGCNATLIPFSRLEKLDTGAFVEDGIITIKDTDGKKIQFCRADELVIPGSHNLENALAAAAVGYFAGLAPEVITETLKTFQGVEHRIEFCGEIDGVRFVNDSKGTNPDASIKAVQAIKGGIVLIAGGYDKNSEYDELINAFDGKVRHMVLLGTTAPKIKAAAERLGFTDSVICADMEECVRKGFELAQPGDTLLLSPACASWDMYDCFEDRGEHFKECMRKIKG